MNQKRDLINVYVVICMVITGPHAKMLLLQDNQDNEVAPCPSVTQRSKAKRFVISLFFFFQLLVI
jgi:hypothetical protein